MTSGERLGRVVGVVNVAATLAAMLEPAPVPEEGRRLADRDAELVGQAKETCELEPGRAVNLVPGGVLPVWWAFAWIA